MAIEKIVLNGVDIEVKDKHARDVIGSGQLNTMSGNLIGAVNEIDSEIGNNNNLTTDNKVIVNAINEINAKVGSGSGGGSGDILSATAILKLGDFTSVMRSNNPLPSGETYTHTQTLTKREGWSRLYPIVTSNAIIENVSWSEGSAQLQITFRNPYPNDLILSFDYKFLRVKDEIIAE